MATIDIGAGEGAHPGTSDDDTFVVTGVVVSTPPPPGGTITGGEGFDTVDLRNVSPASVTNSDIWIGNRVVAISSIERVLLGDSGTLNLLSLFRTEPSLELVGGTGNDTFGGVSGNYNVSAGEGDDGVDLYGVFGSTTTGEAHGGGGTDTLFLADGVTADLAAGTASGGGATYTISGFEVVEGYAQNGTGTTAYGSEDGERFRVRAIFNDGTAGVSFFGRGGEDTIDGSAGADVLDGGADGDSLAGGQGNDIYYVDSVGDAVIELIDEGTDTVRTTLNTYSLPGNVERLEFTGLNSAMLIGNALNNVIRGGSSFDTLAGGFGDDVYLIDFNDTVIENAGEGVDTILLLPFSGSFFLPANSEVEVIGSLLAASPPIDIAGNDFAQRLAGNNGVNRLVGGGGADTLTGGAGEDTLTGGAGNDIFRDTADGLSGDTIVDLAVDDVIHFTDADAASFAFSLSGVTLTYTGGALTLENLPAGYGLASAAAVNGGVDLKLVAGAPGNVAPTVLNSIADQSASRRVPLSVQLPANTFSDPDGDPLSLSASLASGDPLPAWLAFDPATRTFAGTPPVSAPQSFDIRVSASDGAATVSDTFTLTISSPPAAIVTLEPGQSFGVFGEASAPASVFVQGTTASETLNIRDHVIGSLSNNFRNSADTVTLSGKAEDFTVVFDGGSFVQLYSVVDDVYLSLPVQTGFGITLKFETAPDVLGDTRLLRLVADDNGDGLSDLFLGGQRIEAGAGEAAVPFSAPAAAILLDQTTTFA